MSIEIMLARNLEAIDKLTVGISVLRETVVELVEVTKALHRERAAQIREEMESLDPEDPDIRRRPNFALWHLHERLKALEMPPRAVNGHG